MWNELLQRWVQAGVSIAFIITAFAVFRILDVMKLKWRKEAQARVNCELEQRLKCNLTNKYQCVQLIMTYEPQNEASSRSIEQVQTCNDFERGGEAGVGSVSANMESTFTMRFVQVFGSAQSLMPHELKGTFIYIVGSYKSGKTHINQLILREFGFAPYIADDPVENTTGLMIHSFNIGNNWYHIVDTEGLNQPMDTRKSDVVKSLIMEQVSASASMIIYVVDKFFSNEWDLFNEVVDACQLSDPTPQLYFIHNNLLFSEADLASYKQKICQFNKKIIKGGGYIQSHHSGNQTAFHLFIRRDDVTNTDRTSRQLPAKDQTQCQTEWLNLISQRHQQRQKQQQRRGQNDSGSNAVMPSKVSLLRQRVETEPIAFLYDKIYELSPVEKTLVREVKKTLNLFKDKDDAPAEYDEGSMMFSVPSKLSKDRSLSLRARPDFWVEDHVVVEEKAGRQFEAKYMKLHLSLPFCNLSTLKLDFPTDAQMQAKYMEMRENGKGVEVSSFINLPRRVATTGEYIDFANASKKWDEEKGCIQFDLKLARDSVN